jgi:UPF0755 protein
MKNRVKKTKRRMTRALKRMSLSIVIVVLLAVLIGGRFFRYINASNVDLTEVENEFLEIPNGASFADLKTILCNSGAIKDIESFEWVAKKKKYTTKIKGGRYELRDGMSNNQLVNLLRSGQQSPVNLTFNNIRKLNQLASIVSQKLMLDSVELVRLFNDESYILSLGFSKQNLSAMFIPNTYQMYWNTDAKGFVNRMNKEYKRFWNEERKNKAKKIGLSPDEVSVLASIVDEETIKNDEKPTVAGLYLNRLKKNMRLQADPTVKFALDDFTIKRVLNGDKEIDSPYNTYKYAGLPPGPIRIPSIKGIDAVLNYESHKYLYMCAREDFSGYHNFATTLSQHNRNAAKYQRELNKRGILR